MTNPLAPYVTSEPLTPEEFRALIESMEEAITDELDGGEIDALRDASHGYTVHGRLLTNSVLGEATGYSAERISGFRSGAYDIPRYISATLRLLHDRVKERPDLAAKALRDWIEREGND